MSDNDGYLIPVLCATMGAFGIVALLISESTTTRHKGSPRRHSVAIDAASTAHPSGSNGQTPVERERRQ